MFKTARMPGKKCYLEQKVILAYSDDQDKGHHPYAEGSLVLEEFLILSLEFYVTTSLLNYFNW